MVLSHINNLPRKWPRLLLRPSHLHIVGNDLVVGLGVVVEAEVGNSAVNCDEGVWRHAGGIRGVICTLRCMACPPRGDVMICPSGGHVNEDFDEQI